MKQLILIVILMLINKTYNLKKEEKLQMELDWKKIAILKFYKINECKYMNLLYIILF